MPKKKGQSAARPTTNAPHSLNSSPTLLIATRNRGKVEEIQLFLSGLDLDIRDLSLLPNLADIEETEATFAQNALLKAHHYYQHSGLLTMADDSGLEVAALSGAPGVYSARYAGPNASDAQRNTKLLEALQDIPDSKRSARFICAVALVGPNQLEKTFTGVCEGRINHEPVGDKGFGYDPIFEYLPLRKTFAQLSREEKSSVSHRGRAMEQLREFLQDWAKQSA